MFTSAAPFFARLTEVEKCTIRGAQTIDRLNYLFDVKHRFEFDLKVAEARKAFIETVDLIRDEFTSKGHETGFGLTWRF